ERSLAVLKAWRDSREERVAVAELAPGSALPLRGLLNDHTIGRQIRHLHRPMLLFVRQPCGRVDLNRFGRWHSLPPFRHAAGYASVLVAGEAEADEPLAVELPRRLLQDGHPPPVVLDQVVVGGEDIGDALLLMQRGDGHFDLLQVDRPKVLLYPAHCESPD